MLCCPPLQERVYRENTLPTVSPITRTSRDVLYKQWPEWRMEKATEAVKVHKVFVRLHSNTTYQSQLLETGLVDVSSQVLLAVCQSTLPVLKRKSWRPFFVVVE